MLYGATAVGSADSKYCSFHSVLSLPTSDHTDWSVITAHNLTLVKFKIETPLAAVYHTHVALEEQTDKQTGIPCHTTSFFGGSN